MHCLWEIIDNSVDEALAGVCTRIDVTLHPDGSAEVARQRPRHPGRQGAEDRALRRRGGLHQAARRRQVRRRLLQRHRRPARRRLLGRQRALGAPRRRGRPLAGHPAHVLPARRARASSPGDGPSAPSPPQSGLHKGKRVAKGRHRHPGPVLAGPADLHQGRDVRVRRAGHPGPADVVHRPRPRDRDPRPARRRAGRGERSSTTAASPSTASSSPTTSRSPSVLRLQGHDRFTETVPLLDDKGHMTPQDVERDLHVDVALRWGTGYDTEMRSYVNVIATPKGGTHVGRLRGGADQDLQRRAARDQDAQGRRARRGQGRRARGA